MASSSSRLGLRAFAKKAFRGAGSQATMAFLERQPDVQWIDIEMMGYWLRKCDEEHGAECRKPFGLDPAYLGRPKWLVDVQRMCLSVAKPDDRYACLSYVWGNVPTLKTGKANLASLLEENSLASRREQIPKTIRDAIGLCAQLGIPFLWVDALCIVQDDLLLKHDEIQVMAGIYANAYLTFIAGNGWDANHGLRGIQGVTEPRHLSSSWKLGFIEDVSSYESIWYSRGWTFQEMVFSPRKIMFDYQLAIWECNKTSWHESSLSKVSSFLAESKFEPSVNPWKSRINLTDCPDVSQYIAISRDYTKRRFTYAEDSLHAITSFLSIISPSFARGFISGLPEMFFDEAILWQPAEPMQRRQASSSSNNLPSWSWAGWEGDILMADWRRYWSHLPPIGSRVSRDQDSYTRLARCRIRSAVNWFYGNTLDERKPVLVSGRSYIDHLDNPSLEPPSKWSYSHGWFYYNDDSRTQSSHPIPVSQNQPPRVETAHFIFCSTKRAFFDWQPGQTPAGPGNLFAALLGANYKWIGSLNIALCPYSDIWNTGNKCELVVLSEGTVQRSDLVRIELGMWFDMRGEDFLGIEMIEFYNVLWIEWEEGIAYRKGTGKISKKAFDNSAPEDIDLVLG